MADADRTDRHFGCFPNRRRAGFRRRMKSRRADKDATKELEEKMANEDTTRRSAAKAREATGAAAERTADATRAAADAGTDAARQGTDAARQGTDAAQQGAERLQAQMSSMLDVGGRASQEAARRTSENLELMRRLAETMASGVKETSSELMDWARQATERQTEATRQITQARSMEEVLDVQNRYIRENLQSLLDFSAKVQRQSADRASQASDQLKTDRS
jgi:hypothetical protein